jgi:hypothetical protein
MINNGKLNIEIVLQLKVREHPVLGPYVENLTTYAASSFEDIQGRAHSTGGYFSHNRGRLDQSW